MTPTRSYDVYIDGASRGNPGPAGVGVVFLDGSRHPIRQFSKSIGETTNNVAEYLALIYALQEALQAGYASLSIKTDSELLARQLSGQYKVRDARLLEGSYDVFNEVALRKVYDAVFSPAYNENNDAVSCKVTLPIRFELK